MCENANVEVNYFIAHYSCSGNESHWWDADNSRWIPAGMCLYRFHSPDIDDVFKEMRKARKMSTGWYDDIYIDSFLRYVG